MVDGCTPLDLAVNSSHRRCCSSADKDDAMTPVLPVVDQATAEEYELDDGFDFVTEANEQSRDAGFFR